MDEQETSKAIRIFGSFKEAKEEVAGHPPGKYLYIETSQGGEPVYIPHGEFTDLLQKARSRPKINAPINVPQVGVGEEIFTEKTNQGPDFAEMMDFLAQKINLGSDGTEKEMTVTVISDAGVFLELPWEDIANKEIYVFRRVTKSENKDKEVRRENNLLLLLSHAHEDLGEDLKKKMDEEVRGIFALLNFFLENEQQSFRMQKILLSKHTTKQSLESINWGEYNYIHIIMHGLLNGELVLENPDKAQYKYPDPMSMVEFLDILKGKNLDLIFLSFCFSGGGLDGEQESLAVQLTKHDASQYVIAYSYPVGDTSAASFAKIFYEYLINGSEIEQVYKKALQKYYQLSSAGKYIPLLYTCNQST
jgi:hypothetical protein